MTEEQIVDIVRCVVAQVLAEQGSPTGGGASPQRVPERRALVLFTGAWLGFDAAVRELHRLREGGMHLDIIQTESARRILDQQVIASLGPEVTDNLVSDHPMLIIPTLTVNCAAKVAHGMADSLATNVIHEFILLNRPIVAARTAACPDDAAKRAFFPAIPDAFAAVLRANLTALADFGVRLCSADRLHDAAVQAWPQADGASRQQAGGATIPTPLPDLVSHATLADIPDGGVLHAAPRALITALARDEATQRGIRIERQEH